MKKSKEYKLPFDAEEPTEAEKDRVYQKDFSELRKEFWLDDADTKQSNTITIDATDKTFSDAQMRVIRATKHCIMKNSASENQFFKVQILFASGHVHPYIIEAPDEEQARESAQSFVDEMSRS